MDLSQMGNAQYIALETFRKNGTGVVTPVWVAGENGKLYVWTGAGSWKVKRIRNNGRIRLAPSDARGKVTGEWMEAMATVANKPDTIKATKKRMAAKYGFMFHIMAIMGRVRNRDRRTVIEITAVAV
ncbi:MAG: PPOX class F420-dependent oxidoreductase [Chloroflexi bacterium]|nr:PPOX class F420-dependent oxidoreductase [Chloroflexota bacterium]